MVNALLQGYPSEDAFASVTALTNRPVSLQDTLWPKSPKLDLVSGIDLLADAKLETLEDELKRKVANADKITHVYFFGAYSLISNHLASANPFSVYYGCRSEGGGT